MSVDITGIVIHNDYMEREVPISPASSHHSLVLRIFLLLAVVVLILVTNVLSYYLGVTTANKKSAKITSSPTPKFVPYVSPTLLPKVQLTTTIQSNLYCKTDSDCGLIDIDDAYDCPRISNCKPVDNAQGNIIAVNTKAFNERWETYCTRPDKYGTLNANCDPKAINEQYQPKCTYGICSKVNINALTPTTIPTGPQSAVPSKYLACGCGCCGSASPIQACLYHSQGDSMETIIQQDKEIKQHPNLCELDGCSVGTEYQWCD